ncbi:hypothetical protein QVD17_24705 [Tagetes erecta]|uniref:Uncharacterized protein n=1 Tax=Tagetes erecta TaxID=13708 RepID=A0AAD8NUP7_TARER|nr:hypothetical protein QVD17_24705 [Tagetes erecta]
MKKKNKSRVDLDFTKCKSSVKKKKKSVGKRKQTKVKDSNGKKAKRKLKALSSLYLRTTPRPLWQAVRNLSIPQQECVSRMGFHKLLQFKVDGIPAHLAHFVVDAFDPVEMVIKIEAGYISVTKEKIEDIFGLRNGGHEINTPGSKISDEYMIEWNNSYHANNVTATAILQNMYHSRDADLMFKINFLMLFYSTIVHCNKLGNCSMKSNVD